MSDESTITASALLVSLAPQKHADLSPPGVLNGATLQASDDTDKNSFSSILASNIDAGSGSNETGDELDGAEKPSSNALLANEKDLANSDAHFELAARSQVYLPEGGTRLARPDGGNTQSSSGDALPLQDLAVANAGTTLENFFQDLDTVDIQDLPGDQLSNDSTMSETAINESSDTEHLEDLSESNAVSLSETGETAQAPLSAATNSISATTLTAPSVSANHSIETPGLRTHIGGVGVATDSSSNANQQNLSDQQTATPNGASSDSDLIDSASQDSVGDRVFENRLGEPISAKFSTDRELSTEQIQTSSALGRSGESLSNTLSSLNSLSAFGGGTTSPLTTSATATLPPSLYSASPTERGLASQQIAQQISSFISAGDDYAEINLSPPHLGKITVRIALQNEQASILMSAPSPEIRDLLEGSLPKLSALLSDAGLSLADSHVSDQSKNGGASDTSGEQSSDNQGTQTRSQGEEANPTETLSEILGQHNGRTLFDAYA